MPGIDLHPPSLPPPRYHRRRRALALASVLVLLLAEALLLAWSPARADFPGAGDMTTADPTNPEMKPMVEDWLAACKQLVGAATPTELTVASGAVTVTHAAHTVDTEGNAPYDDLENLGTAVRDGHVVILRGNTYGRRTNLVSAAGGAGQLLLTNGNTFQLENLSQFIVLIKGSGYWYELARSYGYYAGSSSSWRSFMGVAATASPTITGTASIEKAHVTSELATALKVGSTTGNLIQVGANELAARNASSSSALKLQPHGGGVTIRGDSVWTAGNDGTGSGLDADDLDGIDSEDLTDVDYVRLEVRAANNNGGGSAAAGTWNSLTFTEIEDLGTHCALAVSAIILDAGTYRFAIRCPAHKVDGHRCRLWDSTGAQTINGSNAFAPTGGATMTYSFVTGRIVLNSQSTLYVKHYTKQARADDGLGAPVNSGDLEVYAVAEFWRLHD